MWSISVHKREKTIKENNSKIVLSILNFPFNLLVFLWVKATVKIMHFLLHALQQKWIVKQAKGKIGSEGIRIGNLKLILWKTCRPTV